jgi:tRNA(Ile)-lysidine synthase
VRAAEAGAPVGFDEARNLFAGLEPPDGAWLIAVSGGPDSMALFHLLAAAVPDRPLVAATVDHGLRAGSAAEARTVAAFAAGVCIPHHTLTWDGPKPGSGLAAAARAARYRLLTMLARQVGAVRLFTAHTLDDQAETVLARLLAGSGPTGLAAMARETRLGDVILTRPLLGVPKSRLVATCEVANLTVFHDPTNDDPSYLRPRLRQALMPALRREGLSARRLGRLADRLRRMDEALEQATDDAAARLPKPWPVVDFLCLPADVRLRLLRRAMDAHATEGPVELGALEALGERLARAGSDGRFAATLAGAKVSITGGRVVIGQAPARRTRRHADGRSPAP